MSAVLFYILSGIMLIHVLLLVSLVSNDVHMKRIAVRPSLPAWLCICLWLCSPAYCLMDLDAGGKYGFFKFLWQL